MPFQPGVSGNPAGSKPKSRRFLTVLERAIEQDDWKRIRAGCETVLDKAAQGDEWAMAWLADRIDGKAIQQLDHGNANGEPFVLKVDAPDGNL